MMNKRTFIAACLLTMALFLHAQGAEFETAAQAVRNMRVGWNLGNTFDSHKIGVSDVTQTETMRYQPVTKIELMEMMKMAGFNAIRVPVTWYPHLTDASGTIQTAWPKRTGEGPKPHPHDSTLGEGPRDTPRSGDSAGPASGPGPPNGSGPGKS